MHNINFEDELDKDLSRRKQEISKLFLLAQDNTQEVVLKSLILLIYAHWEGFIKRSAKLYLQHISNQNIKLSELEQNFVAISLKKYTRQSSSNFSVSSIDLEMKLLKKIMNKKENFKVDIDVHKGRDGSVIDTESNLDSKILKRIYKTVGLEFNEHFETKASILDNKLLKNRNIIAHGDFLEDLDDNDFILTVAEIDQIKNYVFMIVDSFKEQLCDHVSNEYFISEKKLKKAI